MPMIKGKYYTPQEVLIKGYKLKPAERAAKKRQQDKFDAKRSRKDKRKGLKNVSK